MNGKISVLVIGVDAITYLLLYNLHGCAFKVFQDQSDNYIRKDEIIGMIEVIVL